MIDEMMPMLDKEQATSIARKLSSLPSILKCVDGSNIQARIRKSLRAIAHLVSKTASKERLETTKTVNVHRVSSCACSLNEALSLDSQEKYSFCEPRSDLKAILDDLLGQTRCNEIICIAEEIKEIRSTSAFWTKFSKDFARFRRNQYQLQFLISTFVQDLLMLCVLLNLMRGDQ